MKKTASDTSGILVASGNSFERIWKTFERRYPTNQSCLAEIIRRILAAGLQRCKTCNQNNWRVGKKRLLRCKKCKSRVSITSGTFFEHVRAYKAWLAAIWLAENGVLINSVAFHKLLGIAQSSAHAILHKVMAVLRKHMTTSVALAPSASFLDLFCRRSGETPAKEHPRAEEEAAVRAASQSQESNACDQPSAPSATTNPRSNEADLEGTAAVEETETLSSDEKRVLENLNDVPCHQNDLSQKSGLPLLETLHIVTMLEIGGFCSRLPGNHYVSTRREPAADQPTPAESAGTAGTNSTGIAKQSVRQVFHGISRKHLQGYLALHWCFVARSRWCNGSLLDACIAFGKLTSKQVREFVTPLTVRVSCLQSKLIPVFA